MENYQQEIVDNIKQEPERHFVVVLPDYQETCDEIDESLKQMSSVPELRIIVKKFNDTWRHNVALFGIFFTCGKCDYVSKYLGILKRHSQKCRGKDYRCSFCDQKFPRNGRKTHELQEHRKGSSWQCNQCPYNTLDKMNLEKHSRTHFKNFSCETCKKKFAYPCKLRDHQIQNRHGVYVKHEITRLDCVKCVKTFATKFRLYMHKIKVHSQQNFHCDCCGKTFKNKYYMRRHLNIHIKVPCSLCRKPIAENKMKFHMKSNHSSGESYLACRIPKCHQKFTSIKKLNEHQSIHIGTKRYKCPTCNYVAKNFNYINSHMKFKSH